MIGPFSATPAGVSNGATVRIRIQSAATFETLSSGTLNIGGTIGHTASFYVYTIPDEIDRLVDGLHKVKKAFG